MSSPLHKNDTVGDVVNVDKNTNTQTRTTLSLSLTQWRIQDERYNVIWYVFGEMWNKFQKKNGIIEEVDMK